MEQIAPLLPPYDVLGLQEDWDDDNHAILDAALDHETRDRFNTPLDGDDVYHTGCYGTIDNASDCFASKGFQALRQALGTGSVDVDNAHLEASGGAEDDAVRAQQVDAAGAGLTSGSTAGWRGARPTSPSRSPGGYGVGHSPRSA